MLFYVRPDQTSTKDQTSTNGRAVQLVKKWGYPILRNQSWGGDVYETTRQLEVWPDADVIEKYEITVIVPSALGKYAINAHKWMNEWCAGDMIKVVAAKHKDGRLAINPKLVDWNNTRVLEAPSTEDQTSTSISQSTGGMLPAPSTGEASAPSTSTARDCQSTIIRAKFANQGYQECAKRAVIAWQFGSRGYGYYVTIPARYAFEVEITLFYCDYDNSFVFATLGASPVLGDALQSSASANSTGEDLDRAKVLDFELSRIGDYAPNAPYHAMHNGALGDAYEQIPYIPEDQTSTHTSTSTGEASPSTGGIVISADLCYELLAQYDDWFARRVGAIFRNDQPMVKLCDKWINALVHLMAQIDLI